MAVAAKSKAKTAARGGGGGGRQGERLEVRRGPWTEQEDVQLVWFVRLLGERRWDFLAKVSGLSRTGKSCRLRWVNYLHPSLTRGRMTPDEERLVVELHAKWGNRWSRIARSMPGRTDNEIKNYWRTHTRKKAKDTRAGSGSTTTSMSASPTSSSSCNNQAHEAVMRDNCGEEEAAATAANQELHTSMHMDLQLWNDIDSASYVDDWSSGAGMGTASMPSPVWEYCSDSLWGIDEEEEEDYKKMLDAS